MRNIDILNCCYSELFSSYYSDRVHISMLQRKVLPSNIVLLTFKTTSTCSIVNAGVHDVNAHNNYNNYIKSYLIEIKIEYHRVHA